MMSSAAAQPHFEDNMHFVDSVPAPVLDLVTIQTRGPYLHQYRWILMIHIEPALQESERLQLPADQAAAATVADSHWCNLVDNRSTLVVVVHVVGAAVAVLSVGIGNKSSMIGRRIEPETDRKPETSNLGIAVAAAAAAPAVVVAVVAAVAAAVGVLRIVVAIAGAPVAELLGEMIRPLSRDLSKPIAINN